VDESSQHIASLDPNAVDWALSWTGPGLRCLELETTMRPGLVVVDDIGAKYTRQVPAAEDEHPVQALRPDGADPPLGERVRARSPDRRLEDPHAFGAEDLVEGTGDQHRARGRVGPPSPAQAPG
jgi:hypothetical protein